MFIACSIFPPAYKDNSTGGRKIFQNISSCPTSIAPDKDCEPYPINAHSRIQVREFKPSEDGLLCVFTATGFTVNFSSLHRNCELPDVANHPTWWDN
ncbi:MAG: hypothetical protein J2P41_22625 [Blastocatellia bacterium]|nr:hypothetical protein [Blastocatellia bacterium]